MYKFLSKYDIIWLEEGPAEGGRSPEAALRSRANVLARLANGEW